MLRLLTLSIFFIPLFCRSQEAKTYLSLEGGGSGIVASANVGKTVFTHKRFKVISQLGLGWTPKLAQSNWPFNIPCQLTCNFGESIFYIEAGVGSTFVFQSKLENPDSEELSTELYLSPVFGFRHESERWFGRIYACSLFNATSQHLQDEVTEDFVKFGIAIGTRF